jgi:hypothetical protein
MNFFDFPPRDPCYRERDIDTVTHEHTLTMLMNSVICTGYIYIW